MKIRFEFKSSYQGEFDYIVHDYDNKEEYRIHYRTALNDYLEKFYNGSKEEYLRDVVGSLYIVHRTCEKIKPEVVKAFRNHLQDEWNKYLEYCKVKNEFNPEYSHIYSGGPATPIVFSGYWENGWHRTDN